MREILKMTDGHNDKQDYFLGASILSLPILLFLVLLTLELAFGLDVIPEEMFVFIFCPPIALVGFFYLLWTLFALYKAWNVPNKPTWKIVLLAIYSNPIVLIISLSSFFVVGLFWSF